MKYERKKVTPGKLAASIAAVVVLSAMLVALVANGVQVSAAEAPAETQAVEAPVPTTPADGNPEDETCKGSYTAEDDAVMAIHDTEVAWVGDRALTNGQLQVYYWMEVQNFLSTYGDYAPYFGLYYAQPLDTQVCGLSEAGETWQQFFLAGALNSWKNYQSLALEAEANGFQLSPEMQQELDEIATLMEQNALMYGAKDGDAFLASLVGNGATMADYEYFMSLYYPATLYFDQVCEANLPTDAEVEAYFTENEAAFAENGVTRDSKSVDVRHVLIMPEGADSSNIRTETFDDAAWAAAETQANDLLAQFEASSKSEDSFAALAMAYSQDGSASNGGLYTEVTTGQMVEAFDSWCFDPARQPGDYGLVKTEFGYHLMYYVGDHTLWQEQAQAELVAQISQELLNEILAKYDMTAQFDQILLAYVNLGGEAETETVTAPEEITSDSAVETVPAGTEAPQEPVEAQPASTKGLYAIIALSAFLMLAAAWNFRKDEE